MTGPKRIQLSRARGWRMPDNTLKVDRTTRYGNPFRPTDLDDNPPQLPLGDAGAVRKFRELMAARAAQAPEEVAQFLAPLRGKNLACWCRAGAPCHGDVLLELANGSGES